MTFQFCKTKKTVKSRDLTKFDENPEMSRQISRFDDIKSRDFIVFMCICMNKKLRKKTLDVPNCEVKKE